MLWSTKALEGARLEGVDGRVGQVDDFLFDQHGWTVRWLVAQTGPHWLGRKVLLAPEDSGEFDCQHHALHVNLSRAQIEAAPSLDSDAPVSRRHELELLQHYGWPVYWVAVEPPYCAPAYDPEDTTLRSVREVEGYEVHATDGDLGHVTEFLLDADGWRLRYMVVDLRHAEPRRKVLIAPAWLRDVDWSSRHIEVAHSREGVRHSPPWDPERKVTPADEAALHEYYDLPFQT